MFDSFPLNAAQREAVTHGEGPLLVVAGAGSGKTLTLACRVAHLIENGMIPQRILLLTFTRRAAREMLGRADRLTGREATGRVWGGTFHAVANRLLRRHGRSLGIRPDFTVMDQADAADLMNLIRGEQERGTGRRRFPTKDTLVSIYSRTVNAGSKLGEVLKLHYPWCAEEVESIRSIFRDYTGRKARHNLLDYDDLLLYWSALAWSPRSDCGVGALFDHILVDEYQDSNALQARILRGMRRDIRNITVVGDDAQAIYSFRAATNRNILEFPRDFPGSRIIKLEQNYRSTPPILEASNAVIALSSPRHEKTLRSSRPGGRRPVLLTSLDEMDQTEAVCRLVLEHREQGTPLKDQAVLFRAAHHSDRLEVELGGRNIPFVKYGGLKFLEAAHIKDVMSLLRVLENPRDEVSWFRVLQMLEGVGPTQARRLMEELGLGVPGAGVQSPLHRLVSHPVDPPPAPWAELAPLARTLDDCSGGIPPGAQIERIRRFMEPIFQRRYASFRERLRDIEQLEQIARGYPSRGRFLAELALDPPSSTGDLAGPPLLDEDYLILSTIHSAKGCEWDVVYVIHAADGMIPSDMATSRAEEIEEERRLFYVALTRAKNMLYVTFPLRYYRRPGGLDDSHNFGQLTRFLPDPIRRLFDQGSTFVDGEGADGTEAEPEPVGGVQAVRSFLADLWSE